MALNTFCLSLLQYFAKVLNYLYGSHLWQSYSASRVTTSHYLRHSSFVPRHFFASPSSHSPFEGSQRQLGMCTTIAEYVRRGRFVSFSSLSPFGGSGAYRINDSPQIPPFEGTQRQLGMCKGGCFIIFSVALPPSAYGLRPITSSSFFRLETPILTFLALLYCIMNQPLIYPSYTNRPRFV